MTCEGEQGVSVKAIASWYAVVGGKVFRTPVPQICRGCDEAVDMTRRVVFYETHFARQPGARGAT